MKLTLNTQYEFSEMKTGENMYQILKSHKIYFLHETNTTLCKFKKINVLNIYFSNSTSYCKLKLYDFEGIFNSRKRGWQTMSYNL